MISEPDLTFGPKNGKQRPWLVAISGLMGAGKTTLAKQVARAFGWRYVPQLSGAKEYVRDLFKAPGRWAFEAQTALFCSKAVEICERFEEGQSVVVDRSLEEDASIFAPYFRDAGYIDERGFATYLSIAGDFLKRAGPPDCTILCGVSPEIAWQRLKSRGRGEENYYPADHLEKLASEYQGWAHRYDTAPLFAVDSELLDWRKPEVAGQICNELATILRQFSGSTAQLDLFGQEDGNVIECGPRLLVPARRTTTHWRQGNSVTFPSVGALGEVRRVAYLAAPYTGVETVQDESVRESSLYEIFPTQGRIPPGPYRSSLLAIARTLREYGFQVIVPHRDVSGWGTAVLTPKDVMEQCTEHVRKAELFVGLLAESCGAHYEFGLALGLGKPCILIASGDHKESMIAQGAEVLAKFGQPQQGRLLYIKVDNFEDAAMAIRSKAVLRFIESI
jgi:deoxyadenosine/deoxycytidine kinase